MKKIESLEGLRGLAAFVVVLFHFFSIYFPALVNGTPDQVMTKSGMELIISTSPLNIVYNGSFSVYVFFVLSGYVLSYKFFRTGDNEVITASAFKRYFRLVIPVVFSVLCMYVIYALNLSFVPKHSIVDFSLKNALYEGLFGAFFRHNSFYNPVLWTMNYEFIGSFLVFALCLIFGKNKNRIWGYLLFIAIFWNTQYLAFILGMTLSDWTSKRDKLMNGRLIKFILLGIALFIGSYPSTIGILPGSINISSTMYSFMHFKSISAMFYHTIGAAILVAVMLHSKTLNMIFSSYLFQFLGLISFSMYVIHPAIMTLSAKYFYDLISVHFPSSPHEYRFLTMFLACTTIIFIVSYFMAKYVDRAGVKLANFMYGRFFKERVSVGEHYHNKAKHNNVEQKS